MLLHPIKTIQLDEWYHWYFFRMNLHSKVNLSLIHIPQLAHKTLDLEKTYCYITEHNRYHLYMDNTYFQIETIFIWVWVWYTA